jgi:hypothetical protein
MAGDFMIWTFQKGITMLKRIDQLPVILTSFAYREEYFPELDGMLATIRQHHPDWQIVTGRGPIPGYNTPTLDVESSFSSARYRWSLPVSLDLNGTQNDWYRIAKMKGWWVTQVWHHFRDLLGSSQNRVLWFDADGRLNGSLDFEVEPDIESVTGVWWTDPGTPPHQHHICGGLLLFQGARGGIVHNILDRWAAECVRSITLPQIRSQYLPGPDTDQCLLTDLLKEHEGDKNFTSVKLPYNKYCAIPDKQNGAIQEGALVAQRMMNEKMRAPEDRNRNWPPAEAAVPQAR